MPLMEKSMLKRIHKTVEAYYITNKDVLSEEEIKDLLEQMKALEQKIKQKEGKYLV